MTDKEKIKAEIKRRIVFQKECIKNSYRLTGKPEEEIILEYKQLLSFINSLPEELVSNVLEKELDKYIKDNFTIDKEQLDRFNIEEKDYMYSMDKSDMLKMIRYFTNNYKVPASNDLEEAAKLCVSDSLCITNEEDWDAAAVDALNIFKVGAKWQKEQFEKNRLAACDRQTEKEAETERDFVTGIIENEHRQPTFDDAIKYGMRLKEKEMQSTIELAEDHAMFAGMEKMKEEMMKSAVTGQIENGDDFLRIKCLSSGCDAKDEGKLVKLIIIKEG